MICSPTKSGMSLPVNAFCICSFKGDSKGNLSRPSFLDEEELFLDEEDSFLSNLGKESGILLEKSSSFAISLSYCFFLFLTQYAHVL